MKELQDKLLACPIKDLAPALGVTPEQILQALVGLSTKREDIQVEVQEPSESMDPKDSRKLDLFYANFAYRTARLLREHKIGPDQIFSLTRDKVLSWNTAGEKTWIDIKNYLEENSKSSSSDNEDTSDAPDTAFLSKFSSKVAKFLSSKNIGPKEIMNLSLSDLANLGASPTVLNTIYVYQKQNKVHNSRNPLPDASMETALEEIRRRYPEVSQYLEDGCQESLRSVASKVGVSFERVRQILKMCCSTLIRNKEFSKLIEEAPRYLTSMEEFPNANLVVGYNRMSNYSWVFCKTPDFRILEKLFNSIRDQKSGIPLSPKVDRDAAAFLVKIGRAEVKDNHLRATIPYLSCLELVSWRIVEDAGKPLHRDEIQAIAEEALQSTSIDVRPRLCRSGLKNQGKSGMWGLPTWITESRSAKYICIDLLRANGPMSFSQLNKKFKELGRVYKTDVATHVLSAHPSIFHRNDKGELCLSEWGGAPTFEDAATCEKRFISTLESGDWVSYFNLHRVVGNSNRFNSFIKKHRKNLEFDPAKGFRATGKLDPNKNDYTIEGRLLSEIEKVASSFSKGKPFSAQELKAKLTIEVPNPTFYKVLSQYLDKNKDVEKLRRERKLFLTRK